MTRTTTQERISSAIARLSTAGYSVQAGYSISGTDHDWHVSVNSTTRRFPSAAKAANALEELAEWFGADPDFEVKD